MAYVAARAGVSKMTVSRVGSVVASLRGPVLSKRAAHPVARGTRCSGADRISKARRTSGDCQRPETSGHSSMHPRELLGGLKEALLRWTSAASGKPHEPLKKAPVAQMSYSCPCVQS